MPATSEDDRISLVSQILREELGLTVETVEPLSKGVNTFVYIVSLVVQDVAPLTSIVKPGVVPLPSPTPSKVVFRLSNPDSQQGSYVSMNKEAAVLTLIRSRAPNLPVADLYGWSAGPGGWMVLQQLPGTNGQKVFDTLSPEKKAVFCEDFASILHAFQSIPVLDVPRPFGGLAFDSRGELVIGPHPLGYGGPHGTVTEYQRGMLDFQVAEADKNDRISGWRSHGIRDRIDKFCASPDGFAKAAAGLPQKPTFVHFDLDPGNLLVDPDTGAIVGVVDFELSHVGLASDEFLNGLVQLGTFHPGPYDDESPEYSLALLAPSSGFADDIPLEGPGAGNADWSTARLVEAALGKQDVLRPRTIDGFEAASRLYWFMDAICPWFFANEKWWARVKAEEEIEKQRHKLSQFLEFWGF